MLFIGNMNFSNKTTGLEASEKDSNKDLKYYSIGEQPDTDSVSRDSSK